MQPFAELQQRIGRKTLAPKLLREIPVVLLAYDLLEWQGRDLRALPQQERRALLERWSPSVQHPSAASPARCCTATDWQDLGAPAREPRARWASKA